MKYHEIVIVRRWIPILKEYERTKAKITPRPFRFVKNICEAHHIHKKHSKEFLHRHLIDIDTFEGHPYINEEQDPPQHYKGRFNDTSYETVYSWFSSFKFVNIFKGECYSVFNNLPKNQQFCLVHIDVDIYESYVLSIEYVYPRLSPGGIMICDEYEGYGQKKFIDEYFKDKPVQIKPRVGRNKNENYGIIIYKNT